MILMIHAVKWFHFSVNNTMHHNEWKYKYLLNSTIIDSFQYWHRMHHTWLDNYLTKCSTNIMTNIHLNWQAFMCNKAQDITRSKHAHDNFSCTWTAAKSALRCRIVVIQNRGEFANAIAANIIHIWSMIFIPF